MTDRSIVIQAPAEVVYDLVADPMRMAEWSPECVRCQWIGGATRTRRGCPLPRHEPQRAPSMEDNIDDRGDAPR